MRRISEEGFQRELTRILEALKVYEPEKVILYGSYARGDYNALSDLDLIVIKDTDRVFTDRIGDVLALCHGKIPLEPLVYTPSEVARMLARGNDFLETALREGVVVYEQE